MYFIPFNIKTQPFTETIEMSDAPQPFLIVTRTYKFKTKFTAHQAFVDLSNLGLNVHWADADCKSVEYQIFINLDGKGIADMYEYSNLQFCGWKDRTLQN